MSETFKKMNDYTLEVVQKIDNGSDSMSSYKISSDYRLTRIFNFGTGQVTTLAKHSTLLGGYYSEYGAGAASSLQMSVQDFRDLPSTHEVALMHAKLKSLGGRPPALAALLEEPAPVLAKGKLKAPQR